MKKILGLLLLLGLFSFTACDKGAEDSEAGTEGTEIETPVDHGHGTKGSHMDTVTTVTPEGTVVKETTDPEGH